MTSELSASAQLRLNDRKWRRKSTRWALFIYLTIGLFGSVGWIYIAGRSRDRILIRCAIVFLVWNLLVFFVPNKDDGNPNVTTITENLFTVLYFGFLIAQLIARFILNDKWLRWKASQPEDFSNIDQVQSVAVQQSFSPLSQSTQSEPFLGVSNSAFLGEPLGDTSQVPQQAPAPPLASTGVVKRLEANSITDTQLAQISSLSDDLKIRFMEERVNRGPFNSFAEFSSRLNLAPHEIVKLRDVFEFGSVVPPNHGATGRILDI